MSVYTEPGLKLNFVDPTGRCAVLLENIVYQIGEGGSGDYLVVPEGFSSDGASVPRPLWAVLPPWGSKASKAAIIHDYLLELLYAGKPHPGLTTRKAIDDEFYTALIAIGVSRAVAYSAWLGVRTWSTIRR